MIHSGFDTSIELSMAAIVWRSHKDILTYIIIKYHVKHKTFLSCFCCFPEGEVYVPWYKSDILRWIYRSLNIEIIKCIFMTKQQKEIHKCRKRNYGTLRFDESFAPGFKSPEALNGYDEYLWGNFSQALT